MTVAPQYSPIREPGLAVRPAIVVQGLGSPTAPADWHRTEKAPDLIGELYDWYRLLTYSNQNCFSIEFSMIILKLEFQSSTMYIYIWKYLYGFVSRRCHSIHGSDSSIVRYENEGLCGYVLLNSNFIFLVTHPTKIRFHVWICPAQSSRQRYLEPHF